MVGWGHFAGTLDFAPNKKMLFIVPFAVLAIVKRAKSRERHGYTMYSRSYNKNNAPFTVPRQYSGVAFSKPREQFGEQPRERLIGEARERDRSRPRGPQPKPPIGYSPEAGERLYVPGDLMQTNAPIPFNSFSESVTEGSPCPESESASSDSLPEKSDSHTSFLSSVGALGNDTLMIIALIVLLAGSEGAGDTLMLLAVLLLLG